MAEASEGRIALVLGAGASVDVGLPLGEKLKSKIAEKLDIELDVTGRHQNGSSCIYRILKEREQREFSQMEEMLGACERVRRGMPQAPSIDNYLDTHRDDALMVDIGKLAIAEVILDGEANGELTKAGRDYFERLAGTWYGSFFKLLVENCHISDLPGRLSKLCVISFNYDRCFEFFLFMALNNYFHISHDEVKKLLMSLEIFSSLWECR